MVNFGPNLKILTVLEMALLARQFAPIKTLRKAVKAVPQKMVIRPNSTYRDVWGVKMTFLARELKLARLDPDILSFRAFISKKLIFQFPAYFF